MTDAQTYQLTELIEQLAAATESARLAGDGRAELEELRWLVGEAHRLAEAVLEQARDQGVTVPRE